MNSQTTDPDCELVSSRLIPVDPQRVFRAFTEEEFLAEWWGPKGFRNTFHEFDLRPGGEWRFVMHGPDGKDYPNRSVFEIVEPGRIVFEHLEAMVRFRMLITMSEEAGGTRLTWRMVFPDSAECDKVKGHVPRCNEENFDRLEAVLARVSGPGTDERDLLLTRIIDAPREKVFQAWTDPEKLKEWFAPLPMKTSAAELDVRPGGSNFIVMQTPDGNEMPMKGVYLEVVENERLVITDAFSSAWQPAEKAFMVTDLRFEDLDGRTRYSARVRHWSVEDREQHEKMGFYDGWGQCADQLAALVEEAEPISIDQHKHK